MPYNHSGEIGDLWKHLPLCDVLEIEKPMRYYETNAAYAEWLLEQTDRTLYGIFHAYKQEDSELKNSSFFKILTKINFVSTHRYYGSPGLAMNILASTNTNFYFHDIEQQALDDILKFSEKYNLKERVSVYCGDSINAFLQESYRFNQNDFIFIDPYTPFNCNESSKSFLDVFAKAYFSNAKTFLWYGYDSFSSKDDIFKKIKAITTDSKGIPIFTFDVRQKDMNYNVCEVNPGVPGCGIAVANLSEASIKKIEEYLYIIGKLYCNMSFNSKDASLVINKKTFG